MVSADPPITEVELEFLRLARRKLARLFFVLNKVDYLDPEEQCTAVAFLRQVLCEQAGFFEPPPVFSVSARQGLMARQQQDKEAWDRSGLAQIENEILTFLLTEKTEVLSRALRQQANDILGDAQRRLRLTANSLQLPLVELEERVRLFNQRLNDIEEQHIVAMGRLSREQERLADKITQHCATLLPQSLQYFQVLIRDCRRQEGGRWSEDSTREAIAAEMPGYFEREFGTASQYAQQRIHEALLPYSSRAEELTASVHRLVESVFDVSFERRPQELNLPKPAQPYWRTHKWTIAFGAIPPTWVDRIAPRRIRQARIQRRITEQLLYLLTRNAGDLKWNILENVKKSFQEFRARLAGEFEHCLQATRQAIDAADRMRREASGIAPHVARLEDGIADIQALRERLNGVE